jgi:EmrB/QacA subfamily drug resistance transporter
MTDSSHRQHHQATLAILAIGALAFSLAQTTVIPALGEIQHELGASSSDIAWLVTAYFLVASIATPILGRLGDMFGKERYLAVSMGLFALGSAVCAVGDSLALMIVGRGLQGLGGGVFPLSFGIVRDEFPREKIPSGIALLGAVAGIGGAIGLPLGGLLADQVGFHWIFWLSVVMGAGATVAVVKFVPESPIRTPGKLDLVGAGILAVGLSGVLIAISRGNDWGWTSSKTLGLAAAGLVVLVLFVLFERRHPAPLINMQTLSRRPVLTTNLATLLVGFGLFGTFVLVPQLAELPESTGYGFGLNATVAGLLMAPGGLMMLLVAPIVGRVGERRGSKLPLVVGCLVAAGGLTGLALAHGSELLVVVWICIMNAGVGAAFAALPNLIVQAVDSHETGEATGVNTIMRNIGASIGSQVAASIVAGHVLASGMPEDQGFKLAFLMGAAGGLAAGLTALAIPGRVRRRPAPQQLATDAA